MTKTILRNISLGIISFSLGIFILHNFYRYCSNFGNFLNELMVSPGYILYSPFAQDKFLGTSGKVYLVDAHGKPVNVWTTKYQALYSELTKDAYLYVALIEPSDPSTKPTGGGTGIIQKLDWEGNVFWEYKNSMLHHDIRLLPNGNVAGLVWEKVPKHLISRISGGFRNSTSSDVWSDSIIEINEKGDIVWSWSLYDQVDIAKYPIGPLTPVSDFAHANSVYYYETNPINGKPIYLVSFRHLNKVFMIDRGSKKVIWESPTGMLAYQHDATLLDNGNILVFDNGLLRKQTTPILISSIKEINPKTNQLVWYFDGGRTGAEKAKFAVSAMGGVQRLKNGNTLITNSLHGGIFEITKEREIVLDMENHFSAPQTGPWINNIIFKATKYSPAEINWPKKIGSPNGGVGTKICKQLFY